MSSIKVLKNLNKKAQVSKKEYFLHDVLCFLNDPLPESINIKNVLNRIEKTIPKKLFYNLDYIYVGDFPELKLRDVQSVYMRGAIYITNLNQTEESLYASILHELAHSIENTFATKIYEDQEVAAEFIGKRKKLRTVLSGEGYSFQDPTVFIRTEYNPQFDNFLHKEVGYEKLNHLSVGIFMSAYGATSLREYFANGFEHYYLGDTSYLEKLCPKLYKKISLLTSK